jgi:hypothetical protein
MLVGEMMSGRTSPCLEGATDECTPLVGSGGSAATGVAVRWLPLWRGGGDARARCLLAVLGTPVSKIQKVMSKTLLLMSRRLS